MHFARYLVDRLRALMFHLAPLLGRKSKYEIAPGYKHRATVSYFDDTENTDEWQREVYHAARRIMIENRLTTVCDVGCGGGYKLVHILGKFETTGIDLQETIGRVRLRYPDRRWLAGSFDELDPPQADLVVCADVIEHVSDPDALMRFLIGGNPKWIVISTPERERVYSGRSKHRFGPPGNRAHIREWNFDEFGRYISRFLIVERQEITNEEQATQMIVGRLPQSRERM
jgi:SAM-dependent methyltransferase